MERWIKLTEVSHMTTYSRSTIYRLMSEGHFPTGFKLSPRCRVWKLSEIENWMEEKERCCPGSDQTTSPIITSHKTTSHE